MEVGEEAVNLDWKRVSFGKSFVAPVVTAKPLSLNGSDGAVVRIRNIDATGFELRIQEWDYLDGVHHVDENVSYLVVERGSYTLADGSRVEAGRANMGSGSAWRGLSFGSLFAVPPVVITAVTSVNGGEAVVTRVTNIGTGGFQYLLQEQESNAKDHVVEDVDYIAWEPSQGSLDGVSFEVGRTGNTVIDTFSTIAFNTAFSSAPAFLADMQTTYGMDVANLRWRNKGIASVEVQVYEEQSLDAELTHIPETVGYIVVALDSDGDGLRDQYEVSRYGTDPHLSDSDGDGLDDGTEVALWGADWAYDYDGDGLNNLLDEDADGDGALDGVEQNNGADPANPGSVPALLSVMEAGEEAVDHQWKRITFGQSFVAPVVVTKPLGMNGEDAAVVRIQNIDATGFELRVQEWDYLDGAHITENVSYLVMERGSYALADGSRVEAGRADTGSGSIWGGVSFNALFAVPPVVISAVTSVNGSEAVATRLTNIGTGGFQYLLQEQESNLKDHVAESVDYIAWEPSQGDLGGVSFEVGRTGNTVTDAFSAIAFNTAFSTAPAFLADMQTTYGADVANLRWRNKDSLGIEVQVDEEQSLDSEWAHVPETVGYIVIGQ